MGGLPVPVYLGQARMIHADFLLDELGHAGPV
jgi:hypothetical protein